MRTPTRKQKRVLDFIETYVNQNGYSPTLQEIAEGVKLRSLATVSKHLESLRRLGRVAWKTNTSRSIQILDQRKAIVWERLPKSYKAYFANDPERCELGINVAEAVGALVLMWEEDLGVSVSMAKQVAA